MNAAPIGASETFVSAYWQNLSDTELLSVPWVVDDPRRLPNIQTVKPATMGDFQIETEYALDQSEKPVRCVHCQKHQRHWKGFVLKDEHGARYLLGSKCGPAAYGADYRLANEARNRARRRYNALTALQRAAGQLPELIKALEEAANSAAVAKLRRLRAEFEAGAPKSLEALRGLRPTGLTDNLILSAIRRTRDTAAEAARDAEYQSEMLALTHLGIRQHRIALDALKRRLKPSEPIYNSEDIQLGALEGAEWLLRKANPAPELRDVVARLHGYAALAKETQTKQVGKLGYLSRAIAQDLEVADKALNAIRTAPRFFDPANLDRLSQWAVHALARIGFMTAESSRLSVTDKGGQTIALTLGAAWTRPGDLFVELRAAPTAPQD